MTSRLYHASYSQTVNVAAGATLEINLTPPQIGERVVRLVSLRLLAPAITSALTGETHSWEVFSRAAGAVDYTQEPGYVAARKIATQQNLIHRGQLQDAATEDETWPSDPSAFAVQLQNVYFSSSMPLIAAYINGSTVSQTGELLVDTTYMTI